MLPKHLHALADPSITVRKYASKSLVGKLRSSDISIVRDFFSDEQAHEVYKWQAMALARAGDVAAISVMQMKRKATLDSNARDWLLASQAVLQPGNTAQQALLLLDSHDSAVWSDGVIWAWAVGDLNDELSRKLITRSDDSTSTQIRRWAALGLYQHGHNVPPTILRDNISTDDYLLREWSLHILTAQPDTANLNIVQTLIRNAAIEHPRVVEWAVHAFSALTNGNGYDELIRVYRSVPDREVKHACIAELPRNLTPVTVDFLENILLTEADPVVISIIIQSTGSRLSSLPQRLQEAVDIAARQQMYSPKFSNDIVQAVQKNGLTYNQRSLLRQLFSNPIARTAAMMLLNEQPEEAQMSDGEAIVVGALVALDEEFEYFIEALGTNPQAESSVITGSTYFVWSFDWSECRPVILVARLIGRKGSEHAAIASTQLIAEYKPSFLVNLGISGTLSSDVQLGDVVVGDTVTNYLANSRIEDIKETDSYAFKLAGDPYRTDKWLSDRTGSLKFEAPELYEQWQGTVNALRSSLVAEFPDSVRVQRGELASGPSVAASVIFRDWLLAHKRDYIAVDMESSGVATAAWSDAVGRVRLLVLRGISDAANSDKSQLEHKTKGQIRRLAMVAVSRYLVTALQHIAKLRI